MVAVAAFVAVFILIGLAVIAAAFAGRRGAPGKSPSRASNRMLYLGVGIVIVGIGAAIPIVLTLNNVDNAEREVVGGIELTSAQVNGRELFAQQCATCHILRASNAVGEVGPNLDVLRPPDALVLNAIKLGRARGNGNMPAALLTGEDAQDVASYVSTVAGR